MSFFINELHYDNTGGDVGEFVEVGGPADADLDGFSLVLYNGANGRSYNTIALQGALSNDGNGFGVRVFDAPGIQNGAPDGLALVDPKGVVLEFLSYEGTFMATDGPAAGRTSVDIGVEQGDTTPIGHSLQRTGTGTEGADFSWTGPLPETRGETNTGQVFRPVDGGGEPTTPEEPDVPSEPVTPIEPETPTEPEITLISAIQGEGDVSPMVGRTVTVEAIVVGDFQNGDSDASRNLGGFFLQEEDADSDGNAMTSEGIFVFEGALGTDVKLGDKVRVTGVVGEHFGETQLSQISAVEIVSSDNPLPSAAVIQLPAAGTTLSQNGRVQPDLEAFEGMRVVVQETLTITEQFQLGRFNEIKLFDTNGFEQAGPGGTTITGERPFQFSQFNRPDADANAAYLETVGARSITYDDGLNQQNQPIGHLDGFQGYDTATAPRMGDTVTGLAGILDYKWAGNAASGATWRVRSAEDGTNRFESANPRPDAVVEAQGALKVAAFNVLNFFTTLDQFPDTAADNVGPDLSMEPRGADTNPQGAVLGVGPTDEYDRQLAKLVEAISGLGADILGLVEIENDFKPGGVAPGDQSAQLPRPIAVEALVEALNAREGEPVWAAVDPGAEFIGGDAIAVGMIYRTDAVRIADGTRPAILTDADVDPAILARSTVDNNGAAPGGSVFDGPSTSRAPLAVTFEEIASGETLTVVANHFKSKGGNGTGPDADQGDGAANFNNMRVLAAEALDAWLKTNPTGSDTANLMLVGDFNAYASEDPIQYLTEVAGFVDVAAELLGTAYTYLFDGLLGTLDYAFASIDLFNRIVDTVAHFINADEAGALDYNLEFGRDPDIFDGDSPARASDHDPVVVGIDFTPNEPPVADKPFTLELLHFSDQEASSAAVKDAPNLSAVLNALRAQDLGSDGLPDNTLTLSSGDLFIPGVFADASRVLYGAPGLASFQIQNELGVQASALGNHDFDLGTALLAGLISGTAGGSILGADYAGAAFPLLSANLDVSTDKNLAPLAIEGGQAARGGVVTSSTVLDVNGETIGVVGATTPTLARIANAGGVTISPVEFDGTPTAEQLDALAAVIQGEVDALIAANPGMNKVILSSHMQRLSIEQELASRLSHVDIIVAGGSNTRLFDENDRPREGDSAQGSYPIFTTDADGHPIAIVNTDGSYKYVGRLVVDFDENGHVIAESYDPTVSGAYATDEAGVEALDARDLVDPEIQRIADEIGQRIAATESNVFGRSDVYLNGNRAGTGDAADLDGVRTQETNLGNLTADANLAYANAMARLLGEEEPVLVSIKNGGGIRASIGQVTVPAGATDAVRLANEAILDAEGNVLKPQGGISQNDIQTALAFNNGLTLLTVTRAELVNVLERALSGLPGAAGGFPQLAGIEMSFDADRPAGERIQNASIVDADGTAVANLVVNGEIAGDPDQTFRIVTLDFLANDGDGAGMPSGEGANRVDLTDLDRDGLADGLRTGEAVFAADGTEQDALAEYLAANFRDTPFREADRSRLEDERIQNLDYREDAVSLLPVETGPILGTADDDILVGTPGDDEIDGLAGDDRIEGLAGDDILRGGDGDDIVLGGAGDDALFGGDGDDQLFGEDGDDRIDGGAGDDVIHGGAGNDILVGGAGRDVIHGNDGDDMIDVAETNPEADIVFAGAGDDVVVAGRFDRIDGGAGFDRAIVDFSLGGAAAAAPVILLTNAAGAMQANDGTFISNFEVVDLTLTAGNDAVNTGDVEAIVRAGAGDDLVQTGAGNDRIHGGDGNDVLSGGAGDDHIDGGDGDDILIGGAGDDTLVGGDGHDIAVFFGEAADLTFARGQNGSVVVADTAADGEGVDTLTGIEIVRMAGVDYTLGDRATGGNDILFANLSGGRLAGGAGDDILIGGPGDDTLLGGSGNDRLEALEGNNQLDGGSGDDLIVSGAGNDTIRGGSGNDWIVLGGGSDIVDGGSGEDVVVFKDAIADYQGSRSFDGFELVSADQSASIRGVERLIFDDGEVDLTDRGAAFDALFTSSDGPQAPDAPLPFHFAGSFHFTADFAASAGELADLATNIAGMDAASAMERFAIEQHAQDLGLAA